MIPRSFKKKKRHSYLFVGLQMGRWSWVLELLHHTWLALRLHHKKKKRFLPYRWNNINFFTNMFSCYKFENLFIYHLSSIYLSFYYHQVCILSNNKTPYCHICNLNIITHSNPNFNVHFFNLVFTKVIF